MAQDPSSEPHPLVRRRSWLSGSCHDLCETSWGKTATVQVKAWGAKPGWGVPDGRRLFSPLFFFIATTPLKQKFGLDFSRPKIVTYPPFPPFEPAWGGRGGIVHVLPLVCLLCTDLTQNLHGGRSSNLTALANDNNKRQHVYNLTGDMIRSSQGAKLLLVCWPAK